MCNRVYVLVIPLHSDYLYHTKVGCECHENRHRKNCKFLSNTFTGSDLVSLKGIIQTYLNVHGNLYLIYLSNC